MHFIYRVLIVNGIRLAIGLNWFWNIPVAILVKFISKKIKAILKLVFIIEINLS